MIMMNWWQRAFANLNIISREEPEASMGLPNPPAFVNLKKTHVGTRDEDKRDMRRRRRV